MPRHKSHRAFSRIIAGRAHPEVDRMLDLPAAFVRRRHRRFFHDPLTAGLLGALAAWTRGEDPVSGAKAGWAHITLDWLSSWFCRQPGGRHVARAADVARNLAQVAQQVPQLTGGEYLMYRLLRNADGAPVIHGGRVTVLQDNEQSSVSVMADDLPDGMTQAEIDELAQLYPGARTRSGSPGLATPPAVPETDLEQRLRLARQRRDLAQAERDAAIAEAEAQQARAAAGHLSHKLEARRQGTTFPQLFCLGFGGFALGALVAIPLREAITHAGGSAGLAEVAGMLLSIAGAWFVVWARLRRIAAGEEGQRRREDRQALRERMEDYHATRPNMPPAEPPAGAPRSSR